MNRRRVPQDSGTPRFHVALVAALALLILACQILGATIRRGTLWGADAYAFFPVAVLIASTVIVLGWLSWDALRATGRPPGEAPAPRAGDAGRGGRRPLALALAMGAAFALFWLFRIRHTLFGDMGPLSRELPLGQVTHLRQPLSLLVHHIVYDLTAGLFQHGHRDPADVAYDTVALGSAVAGALLVPVAFGLATEIVSPPEAGEGEGVLEPPSRTTSLLVAAALLSQGYVQLLFGYVENYTYFTLAMGLYLWSGIRFLRGRKRSPLILCGLALVLAVGLNLAGVVLAPSYLLLAGWGLARPASRRAVARDLAGTAVAFAGLVALLAGLGEARDVAAGMLQIWNLVLHGEGSTGSGAHLLSREHLRDFFNIHFLIGPCAAFLLVPAAVRRLSRGNRRDARLWFLLLCAVPPLAASWMFGDPLQGFPRDWDIFAPFALLYSAAALYCLISDPLPWPWARPVLAALVAVSLFHTAPWIALNTSAERSLERYKTLPISRGRGQFAVGFWYLSHGQKAQAREWFWRSVEAYGGNNAAHYYLGRFAMDEGRYEEAAQHFWVCTQVRPDKVDYRLALADALVLLGHPAGAAQELDLAVQSEPRDAKLWACYGVALSGTGKDEDARRAFDQAVLLAPEDTLYARLRARVGRPDAYARAVREDWQTLATR